MSIKYHHYMRVAEDTETNDWWSYTHQPYYNPRHVPAKRMRDFEYWRNLGEVSALNGFDIEVVQNLNRYR